jgi:Tfp pilus assembly pilus retraction ATPase PilT
VVVDAPMSPNEVVEAGSAIRRAGLQRLLEHLCDSRGSDLHLKAGAEPRVRVHGHLEVAPFPPLTTDVMISMAAAVLPEARLRTSPARTRPTQASRSMASAGSG